jgi:uncharacterized damage-inducible protein DinB
MLYKAWADADLMRALGALPALARLLLGRKATAIVRHFHAVDCIFRAHLLGVPHGLTSVNPEEPAALSALHERVAAIDAWFVEYTRTLHERDLGEAIDVTFTDGQRQALTRLQILLHVAFHGTYHRGNAGVLLRVSGSESLPDRYTSFLTKRTDDKA